MSPNLLFGVVTAQVTVFQFLSIRLSRSIPDFVIGSEGLPAAASARIAEYRRGLGRLRYLLGAALVAAAVLATFVLPIERGERKLVLAAVSIASSLALVAGFFSDRHVVAAISAEVPEPSVRTAPLERRSLSRFYHPAWEAVPITIFFATICLTAWVATSIDSAGAAAGTSSGEWVRLWIFPALQGLIVLFMLLQSLRQATAQGCLMSRAKRFHSSPQEAILLDQRLRRLEIRYMLASKIGVALLLGLIQVRRLISTARSSPLQRLTAIDWILTLAMLALFVSYVLRTSRLAKALSR